MINPFKLTGPTCLSFSGGRTSAYMLFLVLANNTVEDIARWLIVLFENTGKEDEATLRFVRDCSTRWGVLVIWLEYRLGSEFEIVNFETASRNGEPFDAVIQQRGYILPNVRSAYCSSELKVRTGHRYLRSIGWTEWDTLMGIRADECVRVSKFRKNTSPETPAEEVHMPLAMAGITKWDVKAFWEAQPFDLDLVNVNGETPEGNCDLCFKKKGARVMSLVRQKPVRAVWWAKQEKRSEQYATGDGARFRNNRPSYGSMYDFALNQSDIDFDQNEEAIACFCGD
ncbi:MAG: Nin-like protein [Rhodoferax sp.]